MNKLGFTVLMLAFFGLSTSAYAKRISYYCTGGGSESLSCTTSNWDDYLGEALGSYYTSCSEVVNNLQSHGVTCTSSR